uniref:Uncharacterized protein n=1 Tax=viral metagenome TaxID=1070528 RepID=A0A6M3KW04_9ZZZZ
MLGTRKNTANGLPDKDHLYGNYERSLKWQDDLHRRATHKALDMADDMAFEQHVTRTGMGWKELAVIAAALLGGGGLAAYALRDPPLVQQQAPLDSEYEVRFFDADGNPISVPHISERE